MKYANTLSIVLALAAAPAAFAAGSMDAMDMKPATQSQQAPHPVAAEIKKIDRHAGKVTLKHEAIENLGMDAMTMAFPVKDRAVLKNFKVGDTVSVTFDNVNGKATVVDMRRP
ncbi:signal peptide protein [Burkholderiaceae bacterium 16]|nr:signal peptide protein [Burkholderiaceae bacterium 16]